MRDQQKPLIVQSDSSLLLDVHSPLFEDARDRIALFAELEKSPEHIHTYRISPLSLWNAASAGIAEKRILGILSDYSRYPIPQNILVNIGEILGRYGKLRLLPTGNDNVLLLEVSSSALRKELAASKRIVSMLTETSEGFVVELVHRGTLKQELIRLGYPVKDEAPLVVGDPLPIGLRATSLGGKTFKPREYQIEAAEAFTGLDVPGTGFGTVVLPCGSGKTVIGLAVMSRLKTNTLIVTPNVAAVHQWMDEMMDKTTVSRQDIGEYTGDRKEVRPVTIATYNILVWRNRRENDFPHFKLFKSRNWGLIIYDEVHLLPAPVFRITAEIQAVRRLGLTATLVREDGREEDVFALVGPKRYDVPWKELEAKGWIAEAHCIEIRVSLPKHLDISYAVADRRQKFRIASENPLKLEIVKQLIDNHRDEGILIIGQYLKQLREIAASVEAPLITGMTANRRREELYQAFREQRVKVLVVSKVANFAIDLPDASVAIQVSGTFGSRQEEAQRLGRILRPKERNAAFYSLVSRFTNEERFAANRQKFLTEQGYEYTIEIWDEDEMK
jgi:DNA excision repair protein ERCC-3